MRIIVAHNAYQQYGGEDSVVESEIHMLKSRGHEVVTFSKHNDHINEMSKVEILGNTFWSKNTTDDIRNLIAEFKPDLIHSHNTFPLISPSLYWAAERENIPIIQTLHNFRLMCLNGVYLRNNQVCEDCSGKLPWRGILRKCYRRSGIQSAVLASMLTFHRGIGTYRNKVSKYIALNNFCRNKFIEAGLPESKIVVKPNFVELKPFMERKRAGVLFVGRLSVEKGINVLLEAAIKLPNVEIKVAGTGSDANSLKNVNNVTLLGSLTSNEVQNQMAAAVALVMPSIWFENFPRTLVEAFASGLPVIASRIGALAELIEDNVNGLLFDPGNAQDLKEKIEWAISHPEKMSQMGQKARQKYDEEYTAEKNYSQLIKIYEDTIRDISYEGC